MTRNVCLLLVLASLILISILDELSMEQDDAQDIDDKRLARLHRVLKNLESYEIDHISNRSSFSLTGGHWSTNLNESFAYNYESVSRYVASLKRFRMSRSIGVDSTDLDAFGLAEDAFTIRVEGRREESVIKIGHRSTVGFYRYAKLESDSNIYLINEGLGMALVKPKEFFRQKRLISTSLSQMSSISIAIRGKEALDFRKDRNGAWTIADYNKPLDLEKFLRFYNNIAGIPIVEVVPEHEAKSRRFDKNQGTLLMSISWTIKGKLVEKISIVETNEDVVAQSSRSPGIRKISLAGLSFDKDLEYFVKKYSFDPSRDSSSTVPNIRGL